MRLISVVSAGLLTGFPLVLHVFLLYPQAVGPFFCLTCCAYSLFFYHRSIAKGKVWLSACYIAGMEYLFLPLTARFSHLFPMPQVLQTTKSNVNVNEINTTFELFLDGNLIHFVESNGPVLLGLLLILIAYISSKPARR